MTTSLAKKRRVANTIPLPVAALSMDVFPGKSRVAMFYLSHTTSFEWVFVLDSKVAAVTGLSVGAMRTYRARLVKDGVLQSRKRGGMQKHEYRWAGDLTGDVPAATDAFKQFSFKGTDEEAASEEGKDAVAEKPEKAARKKAVVKKAYAPDTGFDEAVAKLNMEGVAEGIRLATEGSSVEGLFTAKQVVRAAYRACKDKGDIVALLSDVLSHWADHKPKVKVEFPDRWLCAVFTKRAAGLKKAEAPKKAVKKESAAPERVSWGTSHRLKEVFREKYGDKFLPVLNPKLKRQLSESEREDATRHAWKELTNRAYTLEGFDLTESVNLLGTLLSEIDTYPEEGMAAYLESKLKPWVSAA